MKITTQIQSILDLVPPTISDFLGKIENTVHLNEEERFQIRLVLEEALTNAIRHGNCSDKGKKVDIVIMIDNNILKMSIKDEGKGFNPNTVADPIKEEKLYKSGGRGIYLIRKNVDSVTFNECGNEITMTKKIGRNIQ